MFVVNIAACEHNPNCDVQAFKEAQTGVTEEEREEILEEIRNRTMPVSTGFWKYILPEASAEWVKEYVSYTMTAMIEVSPLCIF
jgi:hypothetical protein